MIAANMGTTCDVRIINYKHMKKQKHIVITGASKGFGRDLALALAERETVLYLIARSDMSELVLELESRGAMVHTYVRDLTDMDGFDELMQEIASGISPEKTGLLALVNNAGMLDPMGPAGKYDLRTYRKNLELNFVSPLLLTHAFIGQFQEYSMVKRVVMISSGAAQKPYYGWSHYCSTKAGVDMFTRTVGLEQQKVRYPIEAMAFNPGRIETGMQEIIRDTSEEDFPMVRDFVDAWKEGRIGSSEDVAGRLVRQMLSEHFPSGEVLSHRDL